MPLAHICTRGIPIIYYQRKMLLTPYRFAYNIFTTTNHKDRCIDLAK